jgi:hypothetical protein
MCTLPTAQCLVPSFQLTHLFGDTTCFHSFFFGLYEKKSPYTYWLAPGGGAPINKVSLPCLRCGKTIPIWQRKGLWPASAAAVP